MPVMRRLHVGGTTYDTVGEASVTQVQTSGTKIATVSIDGTATDIYAPEGGSSVEPATAAPSMDGTAAVGSSAKYAREDHVHPTDTSRVAASATNTDATPNVAGSIGYDNAVPKLSCSWGSNGRAELMVSPISSSIKNRNQLGDAYSEIITTTGYTDVYAIDGTSSPSTSAKVRVAPSGVTIDKLVTPTTDTMPTPKSYVDNGLSGKQATLVSGTNIKTVNGTSLLGSGNLSTAELPTVTASDNGKVLRVVNGAWAAASLPSASGVSF